MDTKPKKALRHQESGSESSSSKKTNSQHRKHSQRHPDHDGHGNTHNKKSSQQGHSPERSRRISQFSKDVQNLGHSHYSHHPEKEERLRKISQHSKHTDEGAPHEKPERHRRISHYNRDGGHHLKEASTKGHGRARANSRKEMDRHSVATSGEIEAPVLFENTYKLEPDAVFKPAKVKAIIKDVLQENLKGQKYEKNLMASRCLVLSDIIKEKVRQLNLDRFKIVTMVLIGEKREQALLVSSRCLWNHDCDNFASCEYTKGNLCAVGMVFAVYQE